MRECITPMQSIRLPIRSCRDRVDLEAATEEAQMLEVKENITEMDRHARKVCIVGASGKLGQYMVEHALNRGYEVVAVCRERSIPKLDRFKGRITVMAGMTDDPDVIGRAVAGCDAVLTVLAPLGVHQYASKTAQAVLDL